MVLVSSDLPAMLPCGIPCVPPLREVLLPFGVIDQQVRANISKGPASVSKGGFQPSEMHKRVFLEMARRRSLDEVYPHSPATPWCHVFQRSSFSRLEKPPAQNGEGPDLLCFECLLACRSKYYCLLEGIRSPFLRNI